MNKVIYRPKGKAGEYARFACNFYVGCSNGCEYCYLKKGIGKKTLGGDTPRLKKFDKDPLEIFKKELLANLEELRRFGIFFTFTSDPFLKETTELNQKAMRLCMEHDVPVITLTKRVEWADEILDELETTGTLWGLRPKKHLFAFGFSLTGIDEQEQGASLNIARCFTMKKLHDAGFKTWASIEPVIDIGASAAMIGHTIDFCDLYRIGLLSGGKYKKQALQLAISMFTLPKARRIHFKETFLKKAGVLPSQLPKMCVGAEFSFFGSDEHEINGHRADVVIYDDLETENQNQ